MNIHSYYVFVVKKGIVLSPSLINVTINPVGSSLMKKKIYWGKIDREKLLRRCIQIKSWGIICLKVSTEAEELLILIKYSFKVYTCCSSSDLYMDIWISQKAISHEFITSDTKCSLNSLGSLSEALMKVNTHAFLLGKAQETTVPTHHLVTGLLPPAHAPLWSLISSGQLHHPLHPWNRTPFPQSKFFFCIDYRICVKILLHNFFPQGRLS